MNLGSIFKTMFGSDGRPRQQNADNMTPEEKAKEAQRQELNGAMGAELARSFFEASQNGVTDGSNLVGMGKAYSEQFIPKEEAKPASAVQSLLGIDPSQLPQKAAPNAPQMVQPPSAPAMNITPASGTKPGNYRPAQLSFTPGVPSMLANMGLVAPQPLPAFMVTQPTGTKSKNYKPATMTVNAPRPVGPQAMAQIMAAMNNGGATPFAPYGQG
jgi:hypothetical protein